MKKNILLYPHGGSGNHGCEAIVRSSAKILDENLILFSSAIDQDIKYDLNKFCDLKTEQQPIKRNINYVLALIKHYILKDTKAFDRLTFRNIFEQAKKSNLALSIGGDNYCYGVPHYIMFINQELRKIGVPTVLWGCSIEPTALDNEVLNDLRGYKLIIARESLTKNALIKAGLNNVVQIPDPAFVLPISKVSMPLWWKENNTIGINASPMILDCSKDSALTLSNYEELISYILTNTTSEIALIPHVVWEHNDDRIPLNHLYNKFKHSGRIHLLDEDYNAEQLKWIISQCRALITARTHASIAAYSTGVPTIVLGYSIKARGIALDLFGTEDGYVMPVQGLKNTTELTDAYKHLLQNEAEIKATLSSVIPSYKKDVMDMKNLIKKFL